MRAILSVERTAYLIDSTRNDRLGALWAVLATAGLRLGEALGLRWDDVNLDAGTLSVRRAAQRQTGRGIQFIETKSKASKRSIDLSPVTVEALRTHRERQLFEAKMASVAGMWTETGLVFASERGTPMEQGRVWKHWQSTLERLGLPKLRLHDLRHTAISHRVNLGDNPKVVQAFAGHSNIGTTMEV